jgi:putative two-component system response regulator
MRDISGCTVLLVDDTLENMDILVATLGDEVEVAVAMDGESALEAVAGERPDLVLLDIEMPGMDGYEVFRRLRDDPVTASIPIVFLSARSDPEDKARGMEMGALDFIVKPFIVADVLARVRSILTGIRPGAEDAAS